MALAICSRDEAKVGDRGMGIRGAEAKEDLKVRW